MTAAQCLLFTTKSSESNFLSTSLDEKKSTNNHISFVLDKALE